MKFMLTIDTEEDNWDKYSRTDNPVENLKKIIPLQKIFDRYGVRPTYLISYPVATDPGCIEILKSILDQGRCEIGSHCHPWNTPPFDEEINEHNSMLSNLPESLVLQKLQSLHEVICHNFGIVPVSFRAGRWGFSPSVARCLEKLDYKIDTSVSPFVDWREYQGVDFSDYPLNAYRFDPNDIKKQETAGSLVQVPVTIGYLQGDPYKSYAIAERLRSGFFKKMHVYSVVWRLGLFNKIWLSPEHCTTREMIKISNAFLREGISHLNMAFHSTSLMHGLTPFNRNGAEEKRLFQRIESYLKYISDQKIESSTLAQFATNLR